MPIIVLDGPEKAGKSTLARALVTGAMAAMAPRVITTHFTGKRPVMAMDMRELMAGQLDPDTWVIWDRAWPSCTVYRSLGFPQGAEAMGHEAEGPLGGIVRAHGLTLMCVGPGASVLAGRRTKDDLAVHPTVERAKFREYGKAFGWEEVSDTHPSQRAEEFLKRARLIDDATRKGGNAI